MLPEPANAQRRFGSAHGTCRHGLEISQLSVSPQYQAFVRLTVVSGAAGSALALDITCLVEPFIRSGSHLREL
jgi:hypothetical protein